MEALHHYLGIAIRLVLVLGLCALGAPLLADFLVGTDRNGWWVAFTFFCSFGMAFALLGWVWPEKWG